MESQKTSYKNCILRSVDTDNQGEHDTVQIIQHVSQITDLITRIRDTVVEEGPVLQVRCAVEEVINDVYQLVSHQGLFDCKTSRAIHRLAECITNNMYLAYHNSHKLTDGHEDDGYQYFLDEITA